jgi:hypothetical protein
MIPKPGGSGKLRRLGIPAIAVNITGPSIRSRLAQRCVEIACRPGSVTPLFVTLAAFPETLTDLRFHLSCLLIGSRVFSGFGGTETELEDLGPLVAPENVSIHRIYGV